MGCNVVLSRYIVRNVTKRCVVRESVWVECSVRRIYCIAGILSIYALKGALKV